MKTPREILLKLHRSTEPKLDRLWDESLAPELQRGRAHTREASTGRQNLLLAAGWKLWRELVLPSRRIWAGLACAWVVIAVLNLASSEPATEVASQTKPPFARGTSCAHRTTADAGPIDRARCRNPLTLRSADHQGRTANARRRPRQRESEAEMTRPLPNSPGRWQQSAARRFLIWLGFSWRTARRILITIAVIITLVAVFYAEEDLRGNRAWARYRQEAEARGEQLDWRAFIPKPVPDDQNFAATPFVKSWFVIRSNYIYAVNEYWRADNYGRTDGDYYGQQLGQVIFSFRSRNTTETGT